MKINLMKNLFLASLLFTSSFLSAQSDQKLYDIIEAVSAERLQKDVQIL